MPIVKEPIPFTLIEPLIDPLSDPCEEKWFESYLSIFSSSSGSSAIEAGSVSARTSESASLTESDLLLLARFNLIFSY